MAFRKIEGNLAVPESPEALFRDLRGKTIPGLLSQQADVLREYVNRAVNEPDVALELPTGAGKTLVGLLIAEWRRLKFGERAVFLCPTNQLVNQVAEQSARKYGLTVLPFTGSKHNYDQRRVLRWETGESLAITSYSALFNVRPFFESPQFILLDDAHAAENYIMNHWSVVVSRFDHPELFQALAGILRPNMEPNDAAKLSDTQSRFDAFWVDALPKPTLDNLETAITSIFDAHCTPGADISFRWSAIRDHIGACQLYMSANSLLLRPIIAPTETHRPFTSAKQRVYMSATLGEGGELERVTGRKRIFRISSPEGYQVHGIGRRFFIFPEVASSGDVSAFLQDLMRRAGRTLILVPDNQVAESVRGWVEKSLNFPTFKGSDLEDDKSRFVAEQQAVAIVANRYDGIDLFEDECRLLIIWDISTITNLQERFFYSRLGANTLLSERILTRIVQAFGRCTRSDTDYAAVVVFGRQLTKHLFRAEGRTRFHPNLQAEIDFGIAQSRDKDLGEFVENFQAFISQTDEWKEAEREILNIRSGCARSNLEGGGDLAAAAEFEVEYQMAAWSNDWPNALTKACAVLSSLSDKSLRGYRGLWEYIAGSAQWAATPARQMEASERFKRSAKALPHLRWLHALVSLGGTPEAEVDETGPCLRIVERMEQQIIELGLIHDRKYSAYEASILRKLGSEDGITFEQGHEELGRLLGFEAGKVETTGAPDPWWQVDSSLCIVFEDYAESTQTSTLSVGKARQVATHPNWIRAHVEMEPTGLIIPVLVAARCKVDSKAVPHLAEVMFWETEDLRKWARRALQAVRELRSQFRVEGDLEWRENAVMKYMELGIDPRKLTDFLTSQRAIEALRPI